MHWLVEHTPKSVKYRFAKFGYLTGSDPKEKAKIILRVLILRALPHREHWQKLITFDSGGSCWQTMLENLLNVNLPTWLG